MPEPIPKPDSTSASDARPPKNRRTRKRRFSGCLLILALLTALAAAWANGPGFRLLLSHLIENTLRERMPGWVVEATPKGTLLRGGPLESVLVSDPEGMLRIECEGLDITWSLRRAIQKRSALAALDPVGTRGLVVDFTPSAGLPSAFDNEKEEPPQPDKPTTKTPGAISEHAAAFVATFQQAWDGIGDLALSSPGTRLIIRDEDRQAILSAHIDIRREPATALVASWSFDALPETGTRVRPPDGNLFLDRDRIRLSHLLATPVIGIDFLEMTLEAPHEFELVLRLPDTRLSAKGDVLGQSTIVLDGSPLATGDLWEGLAPWWSPPSAATRFSSRLKSFSLDLEYQEEGNWLTRSFTGALDNTTFDNRPLPATSWQGRVDGEGIHIQWEAGLDGLRVRGDTALAPLHPVLPPTPGTTLAGATAATHFTLDIGKIESIASWLPTPPRELGVLGVVEGWVSLPLADWKAAHGSVAANLDSLSHTDGGIKQLAATVSRDDGDAALSLEFTLAEADVSVARPWLPDDVVESNLPDFSINGLDGRVSVHPDDWLAARLSISGAIPQIDWQDELWPGMDFSVTREERESIEVALQSSGEVPHSPRNGDLPIRVAASIPFSLVEQDQDTPDQPTIATDIQLHNPPLALIHRLLPEPLDNLQPSHPLRLDAHLILDPSAWEKTRIDARRIEVVGRWGNLPELHLRAEASGSLKPPQAATQLHVAAPEHDIHLHADVHWQDLRLNAAPITLQTGENTLASLTFDLPFDPDSLAPTPPYIPSDHEINLTLDIPENVAARWESILAPFSVVWPDHIPQDTRSRLKLTISDTIERPHVIARLELEAGTTPNTGETLPWRLALDLSTEAEPPPDQGPPAGAPENQPDDAPPLLHASGTLTLADGPRSILEGSIPLDPTTLLEEPSTIRRLPLNLTVTLPESPLQAWSFLLPKTPLPDGMVAADFHLAGTVDDPLVNGSARVSIPNLFPREIPNIPPVENFLLNMEAGDDGRISARGSASIGGGPLRITGHYDLNSPPETALEASISGDAMLIWRSVDASLRADADLSLQGGLSEATLSGDLGIVQSLYIREFDLLPIGFAGGRQQAPALPDFSPPPPQAEEPGTSPLNRINLDVRVFTRDPLLLRSNLARGDVLANIRVGGTAASPRPEGMASLESAIATLPFSRMNITEGTLILRPDAPLDPSIRLHGSSRVGNHNVRLFFYGLLSDPQLVLSSTPPLPDEEILTLLATGATADDLEGGQLAALKATLFLLDEAVPILGDQQGIARGPLGLFSPLLDNLDFDVGSRDQLTGHTRSSLRLRLGPRIRFEATVDEEGQNRGTMLYFFRVR